MIGLIIIIILLIAGACYGYFSEKRKWNNGVCKDNGIPWKYFDTDSQGGRGYKADNITCWVSWPGIDNK